MNFLNIYKYILKIKGRKERGEVRLVEYITIPWAEQFLTKHVLTHHTLQELKNRSRR